MCNAEMLLKSLNLVSVYTAFWLYQRRFRVGQYKFNFDMNE